MPFRLSTSDNKEIIYNMSSGDEFKVKICELILVAFVLLFEYVISIFPEKLDTKNLSARSAPCSFIQGQ